jgi:hypothetical protein
MHRRQFSLPLVAIVLFTGCTKVGIDTSVIAAVSNDDTYAMLAYVWNGVAATINSKKEPLTSPFSLALSYTATCPGGGTRAYQGTLAGTDSSGTGGATLSLTGSLTACVVYDGTVVYNSSTMRTFTVTGIVTTGTIAIVSDAYATTSVHVTATSANVNGTVCAGGIDVTIVASSPSSQPTATGTVCGRSGVVPLP